MNQTARVSRVVTYPQSVVTLKVADERDRKLWAVDAPGSVIERIDAAARGQGSPMIELGRWVAGEVTTFWARFDNIANVKVYR